MTMRNLDTNPTIEAWLDQFGVRYDLETVQLDAIDRKASAENQARLVAHDPERIRRYTLALEAGAVFPPLVLWEAPNAKRLIVIDGNNRLAAFDNRGLTAAVAYVVRGCSAAMRDALTISANNVNGDPPTDIERRANAVVLRSKGFSQEQVANMTGLSTHVVSDVWLAHEGRNRLPGGPPFSKLAETSLVILNRLKSDDVMHRAARVVAENGVGQQKLSDLVTSLNKLRSEVKQLELVDEFAAGLTADRKQPRPTKRPDVGKVNRAAGMILAVNPQQVAIQANGDVDDLRDRLFAMADHAMKIADAL